MTFLPFTRLPAAALLLACAGNASAGPYAYAYNNIFGLRVFNLNGAASVAGSAHSSYARATLNGAGATTGGANLLDAPKAALGAAGMGENDFTRQGAGPAFARGDAQIVSTQFPPFPPGATSIQAVAAAEASLGGPGSADAASGNGSRTGVAVDLVVGAPGAAFYFDFHAFPYLLALRDAPNAPGAAASATVLTSIRIVAAGGGEVFAWAPDGTLGGGIRGGSELSDGANLNATLNGADAAPDDMGVYDPAHCGEPAMRGVGSACGARFTALTDALAAGNYTLVLDMAAGVDVERATAVSTPATPALVGLGLAALGLARRKWRVR